MKSVHRNTLTCRDGSANCEIMLRFMRTNLKGRWVSRVGLLAVILFVLQSSAVWCACSSGDAGVMGVVSASSRDVGCHGSAPMKGCPCKTSEKDSPSTGHATGACLDCHGLAPCVSTDSEKIFLVSSGPVSPDPVFLTPVAVDPERRSFLAQHHKPPFSNAPLRRARSIPVFVLNSAFLI